MKKILKLSVAFVLSFSLFACGGGSKPSSSDKPATDPKTTEVQEPEKKAEANIDPETIDPGTNYSRDGLTSDFWISTTNSEDYFYLENALKEYWPSGWAITWYYNGDMVLDSEQNEIKDNHLVSEEGSALEFDLVFVDLFTAYDFVSDQWYQREGLEALDVESIFFDKELLDDRGNSLHFYDDYTVAEVWKNEEMDGNWWAINSTQIIYYPNDNTGNGYTFDYYVTTDNALDYIHSFEMGDYYVVE